MQFENRGLKYISGAGTALAISDFVTYLITIHESIDELQKLHKKQITTFVEKDIYTHQIIIRTLLKGSINIALNFINELKENLTKNIFDTFFSESYERLIKSEIENISKLNLLEYKLENNFGNSEKGNTIH